MTPQNIYYSLASILMVLGSIPLIVLSFKLYKLLNHLTEAILHISQISSKIEESPTWNERLLFLVIGNIVKQFTKKAVQT